MTEVRRATAADAGDIGRLLYDFNTEYSEPTPDTELLAGRIEEFIERDHATFLLTGAGPDGFAEIRYRPTVYSDGLDAYLEEFYVAPDKRGQGLGRALLQAAMKSAREAGATRMDLCTSEDDKAARSLYASAGFTDREGDPDGPQMLYYEREL